MLLCVPPDRNQILRDVPSLVAFGRHCSTRNNAARSHKRLWLTMDPQWRPRESPRQTMFHASVVDASVARSVYFWCTSGTEVDGTTIAYSRGIPKYSKLPVITSPFHASAPDKRIGFLAGVYNVAPQITDFYSAVILAGDRNERFWTLTSILDTLSCSQAWIYVRLLFLVRTQLLMWLRGGVQFGGNNLNRIGKAKFGRGNGGWKFTVLEVQDTLPAWSVL